MRPRERCERAARRFHSRFGFILSPGGVSSGLPLRSLLGYWHADVCMARTGAVCVAVVAPAQHGRGVYL